MSNWFDEHAKSSARSTSSDLTAVQVEPFVEGGLSRRDVLKRGGIVAGVAWTAPMLLSVTPAAAAITMCPTGQVLCTNTPAGTVCCPTDYNCVPQPTPPGGNACIQPGGLGGDCLNMGEGTSGCFQSGNSSIHCNGVKNNNICGGPGAQCDVDAECAFPLTCSGGSGNQKFCKAPGP